MVPELLVLPPGTDLHNHHLVANGRVFLQGKGSSMVAAALSPEPGWTVLDACSAPGNKTVNLAALTRGNGKIIACELNKERIKRLNDTVELSGATNIQVLHGDFLSLNPNEAPYSKLIIDIPTANFAFEFQWYSCVFTNFKVGAILLDPSCSGSGTASTRLDHLLPSSAPGDDRSIGGDEGRENKLAGFQRKALEHALAFPEVERVVYSTCSVHQTENEDVVNSVMPLATSPGFHLEPPFPHWQHRGLPVFQGSENLLRTELLWDT